MPEHVSHRVVIKENNTCVDNPISPVAELFPPRNFTQEDALGHIILIFLLVIGRCDHGDGETSAENAVTWKRT
jgi:hypothetical protein